MSQLNADKCFIFTDTETSGLDINFSQIIQVGSVVTDESLVVENEHNLSCNLLPWIIPSPEALLVHKKVDCLGNDENTHYEMMMNLRNDWIEWSENKNPIYVTYNGHRFDEELFRRQFYWCLLPQYITNTSGATRLDLMFTFQIVANFFADKMPIPIDEEGKVSMKLTDWAEANEVSAVNAHDAVADCYLMIHLARIIQDKAKPALQSSIIGSSKGGNLNILQSDPFAMLSEVVRRKKFTYPVTFCGQNSKMPNEVAVVDLYYDPDQLDEMTDSELLEQMGSSGSAIIKLRINKSLPIINSMNVPSLQDYLDIPFSQLEERAHKIKNNTRLQLRISELLSNNQTTYPPPKYVEQSVYSGFASSEDELWMERFHESPWNERSKLIDGFEDSRYRELAERLIWTNSMETADDKTKTKYKNFVKQRTHESGPWLSLDKALEKTQNLLIDAEGERKEILQALENRLNSLK